MRTEAFCLLFLYPAKPRELPEIWRLVSVCRDDLLAHGVAQWDETYPTLDILHTDLTCGRAFAAREENGALLAYFTLNEQDDLAWATRAFSYDPPKNALLIHRLCVHPQHQRRGFGRTCLRFAEQRAAALGYQALLLTVFAQNKRAVSFYQTLGYQSCGALQFEENGDLGLTMYKPV